jgi:uncharacterized protein (DUF1697 family)
MPRFAAFLRGVSPMNCKMPELAAALEAAGFKDVKTVLSSGNVVFTAHGIAKAAAARCEKAMQAGLGRSFMTFVRPVAELQALLEADPYARHRLPAGAKKVVTFFAQAPARLPDFPVRKEQAQILAVEGLEAFSAYVPEPGNPVFMVLIEKTFGKDVTTRTWDTVKKVVAAA